MIRNYVNAHPGSKAPEIIVHAKEKWPGADDGDVTTALSKMSTRGYGRIRREGVARAFTYFPKEVEPV